VDGDGDADRDPEARVLEGGEEGGDPLGEVVDADSQRREQPMRKSFMSGTRPRVGLA
jgi:hypothetical protein